jgi:hypothetical protein
MGAIWRTEAREAMTGVLHARRNDVLDHHRR